MVPGLQGFPLSSVIDEPNNRCNGLMSTESNVQLICQRPKGSEVPVPPSQYLIINCPINMSAGFSSMSASMPTLINELTSYSMQVCITSKLVVPICS